MKTAIISSSQNLNSKSYLLCKEVEKLLIEKGVEVVFIDGKDFSLGTYHKQTEDNKKVANLIKDCDNFIFGMAVYQYSFNANLKLILDTCMDECDNKLFGTLVAAGGQKSYLCYMDLVKCCMNEWRMIPLPRVVFCNSSDFEFNAEKTIPSQDLETRLIEFANDFEKIGQKLIS
tara:strand:- start:3203 stop:3724 length:522 start_codon:yes stop_codon:yes gene_type:complete